MEGRPMTGRVERAFRGTGAFLGVIEQIRAFLTENFLALRPGVVLHDDLSLMDAGIIDSTGVLELVAFVEEAFGIKVDDAEIVPGNFDSTDRIASYVSRKLDGSPAV
jgi:acyl carrier protein